MAEVEGDKPQTMNSEVIRKGLTQFGRSFDGSVFTYLTLDLENRGLQSTCLELGNYEHLQELKLSGNQLQSLDILSKLPHLFRIEANSNRLSSLELFYNEDTFSDLQFLSLARNSLRSLGQIRLPKLLHLNLNNNEIHSLSEFEGHPGLTVLELRGNKLGSLTTLKNLPNLEELYLAENHIAAFEGLEELGSLKKLHLRNNKINELDGEKLPELPELEDLNLRDNTVANTAGITLLKKYKKLAKLSIQGCPLASEPSGDLRKELLILFPGLTVLDKAPVTENEREEALNESQSRWSLSEAARLEAERVANEQDAEEDS